MKRYIHYCFLAALMMSTSLSSVAQEQDQNEAVLTEALAQATDSIPPFDPMDVYNALPQPEINENIVNMSLMPRVFLGYRKIHGVNISKKDLLSNLKGVPIIDGDKIIVVEEVNADSVQAVEIDNPHFIEAAPIAFEEQTMPVFNDSLPNLLENPMPEWYLSMLRNQTMQEDMKYIYMLENPGQIEYAYWDLPVPPVLMMEDRSFMAFLRKQELPEVDPTDAVLPETEVKKVYWLHKVGSQLQFSQAYVSPNWYQGGNSYLSLLFNFNWNVQLNQVYHPNLLFQSDLSYKVAFSSNPSGYLHKYTIAEDNFQYNLNLGLKAVKKWYYSFNLQFKTQLFNNFEENSDKRTAAFLSPADLNMGLGMSYNHANKLKTFQITLTISPLSYNLKACLKPNDIIDHATYGIAADKHTKSEIGSNIDLTMDWKVTSNISYKTRLFMFSDYKYYLCDWQNTFNFDINKFLSTQLFVHLRYDGSTENYGKWKKFMLREILSFGLSYTFSTKP